jgi:hypothetical protein
MAGLVVACGTRPESPPEPEPEAQASPDCRLVPEPAESPGEVRVGLLDEIDVGRLLDEIDVGHAPRPTNPGERLLFRHLYETLIRVDCRGVVRPGLAESWSTRDEGATWAFTLRDDARFWDGSSVTATDVAASWARGDGDWFAFAAGIDSITVGDTRTLAVHLGEPGRDVPRVLASPEFAVARRFEDWYWPLGSAVDRIETDSRGGVNSYPESPALGPSVRFLSVPGADARDMLESSYDVLVTADPTAVDYAATLSEDIALPLPWDRTYVLLSTTRVKELRSGIQLGPLPGTVLGSMARNAVRVDARAYADSSWWTDLGGCGSLAPEPGGLPRIPPGAYQTEGPRRVVFRQGDPVARELAERVVALSADDSDGSGDAAALASAIPELSQGTRRTVSTSLTGDEFESTLRYGNDFAYVLSVPRKALDPCFSARRLARSAEWLAVQELELSSMLIPLVDTRSHVIAGVELVGLSVDWDGTVLIENAR